MSHIVTINTEIRDAAAIHAACQRLHLETPVYGEAKLFSGSKTGWQVKLPDWRYPVVCDVNTGKIEFDNYGERWGKQKELDRFMQGYAVEKAKIEARKKGHSVTEQQLEDGSIKVVVQVGGAAWGKARSAHWPTPADRRSTRQEAQWPAPQNLRIERVLVSSMMTVSA